MSDISFSMIIAFERNIIAFKSVRHTIHLTSCFVRTNADYRRRKIFYDFSNSSEFRTNKILPNHLIDAHNDCDSGFHDLARNVKLCSTAFHQLNSVVDHSSSYNK